MLNLRQYKNLSLLFFIFCLPWQAHASTYSIEIQLLNSADTVYEGECVEHGDRCFASMSLKLSDAQKIDAGIVVENGFVHIQFLQDSQVLSLTAQGWESFLHPIEEIIEEPKILSLYTPTPAIKNDRQIPESLVIRPPNKFLTKAAIRIKKQKD